MIGRGVDFTHLDCFFRALIALVWDTTATAVVAHDECVHDSDPRLAAFHSSVAPALNTKDSGYSGGANFCSGRV